MSDSKPKGATSIKLSPNAYGVLFMHACKHAQRAVNGLLLGTVKDGAVTATETLPLLHSSLALTPMLEAALLLVRHSRFAPRVQQLRHSVP